jgi:hypothetical protein
MVKSQASYFSGRCAISTAPIQRSWRLGHPGAQLAFPVAMLPGHNRAQPREPSAGIQAAPVF